MRFIVALAFIAFCIEAIAMGYLVYTQNAYGALAVAAIMALTVLVIGLAESVS